MNTVFCGEFKKTTGKEEIFEFKYFRTRNYPIYRDTDLVSWFSNNVQNPILVDLEEFQEKESGKFKMLSIVYVSSNVYSLLQDGPFIA